MKRIYTYVRTIYWNGDHEPDDKSFISDEKHMHQETNSILYPNQQYDSIKLQ